MSEQIIDENWKPKGNPWLISAPLMLAMFMFVLDETISNVALQFMAGTFSVAHNESTWILTSYLIASGLVIPSVDFLCKKFGRNNYYLFSVALFTISSVSSIALGILTPLSTETFSLIKATESNSSLNLVHIDT